MKYSPGFQRLLEYAAYDCALRGQTAVLPDHLLLGLYREDFPLIDTTLATFKVDSLVVLDRLLHANPEARKPTRAESVRLSPEGLRAMAHAEREAEAFGHDTLTPPHTLLGILDYNRDHLERLFIRESVFKQREDKVLQQVRELVSWLRFGSDASDRRELDYLDADTIVGIEDVPLPSVSSRELKTFAVRLRMLKRFRAR